MSMPNFVPSLCYGKLFFSLFSSTLPKFVLLLLVTALDNIQQPYLTLYSLFVMETGFQLIFYNVA